jgi:hypothetical protein
VVRSAGLPPSTNGALPATVHRRRWSTKDGADPTCSIGYRSYDETAASCSTRSSGKTQCEGEALPSYPLDPGLRSGLSVCAGGSADVAVAAVTGRLGGANPVQQVGDSHARALTQRCVVLGDNHVLRRSTRILNMVAAGLVETETAHGGDPRGGFVPAAGCAPRTRRGAT